MADFLATGVSGLLAFQRALDTTSHNIANVNTPGYSRQVAELTARQAEQQGSGWLGNGVEVNTVKRMYDDFMASQARTSSSTFSQLDTFATQVQRVNNLFGDSTTGLTASLQNFTNALQSVASSPTSIPARQTLLSQGQALVNRLQSYDSSLESLGAQVNAQLEAEAGTISTLAENIAKLNQQVSAGYARTGQPPNDLLDQRDRLLDELSTHVNVSAVKQGDNSINVFIGNGQPLVVGQTASKLAAVADSFDPTRRVISLRTATSSIDVTENLTGGTLGGTIEFRQQVLDPARNSLGKFSVGLAQVMNDQHAAGLDLQGNLGGDFFAVGAVAVQASGRNTGTASLAVTRTGAGALTNADYLMTYTASGWTAQRADTGAAVSLSGTGTLADPYVGEGLSIVVSGTPQVGDRLKILPTANAVNGLSVLVTDPSEVAAAAPVVGASAATNTGNGAISPGEVLDASNAQLRSTVTIRFLTPTTYSVNGAGSFAYTSGGNIDINGWRVQVSGAPAVGDTFTVADNTAGAGDNRNALRLASALNQPVFSNGSTSLNAAVGQFMGDIGVKTNQAQVGRDAQKVVRDENAAALQSLSGVNLDEEAANLIRFQQAYQAMAQIIGVADKMFQTLLAATRG
jgi:flagellar hook-associated protein 1